eukprot:2731494-Rhodomonas_salina.1
MRCFAPGLRTEIPATKPCTARMIFMRLQRQTANRALFGAPLFVTPKNTLREGQGHTVRSRVELEDSDMRRRGTASKPERPLSLEPDRDPARDSEPEAAVGEA